MARDVLQNLQLCDGSEMQLKPILQSYIELLTRKGLTELATAFAVKAATLDANKNDDSSKNIWG